MALTQWFTTEFQVLTGYEPYAWQTALFNKLVLSDIPKNINLPTGSGKTSTIPVWLLAFIKNPTLPRRLVYVVDRRSVVDQATAVVERMLTRLSPEMQSALGSFTLPDEAPLGISTLRGELADNEEWSKLPFRPAVIVGTVDLIGSRLMFSGYGDGAYDRPRHAGLLGNDTLIIFDECHLVPAFEVLLHNIENAGGKLKPFSVMTMSATSTSNDSLALTEANLENATLRARLNARKRLSLVEATSVVVKIVSMATKQPPRRTIVFVQSPRTVVEIAASLNAIDAFGRRYGLPRGMCGQNQYGFWGPSTMVVVVAIGFRKAELGKLFSDIVAAAHVRSQYALPEERDLTIFVCRNPKLSLLGLLLHSKYLD